TGAALGGRGVFFKSLAVAVTCGRCESPATVGYGARTSAAGSRASQATVGGPPDLTVGNGSGRPQARHRPQAVRFLVTSTQFLQICLSKNDPTRPPTAFAPETPHVGWTARELRPQADGADRRIRPPRPAPSGRQPWHPSRAQPAPPAPRDAPRGQRLAQHAQF